MSDNNESKGFEAKIENIYKNDPKLCDDVKRFFEDIESEYHEKLSREKKVKFFKDNIITFYNYYLDIRGCANCTKNLNSCPNRQAQGYISTLNFEHYSQTLTIKKRPCIYKKKEVEFNNKIIYSDIDKDILFNIIEQNTEAIKEFNNNFIANRNSLSPTSLSKGKGLIVLYSKLCSIFGFEQDSNSKSLVSLSTEKSNYYLYDTKKNGNNILLSCLKNVPAEKNISILDLSENFLTNAFMDKHHEKDFKIFEQVIDSDVLLLLNFDCLSTSNSFFIDEIIYKLLNKRREEGKITFVSSQYSIKDFIAFSDLKINSKAKLSKSLETLFNEFNVENINIF